MPQNQKTAPRKEDDDLEPLNAQEEKLVEAVLAGEDNCAAYRAGYGASGYSPAALRVKACRKIGSPKIQAHLRALRAVGAAKIGLTIEDRIAAEAAFAQRAEDAGNFGAAGGANDRINKLAGLYIDQVRDVTERHDPAQTIRDIAKHAPELAASLAAQHGISLDLTEGATKH